MNSLKQLKQNFSHQYFFSFVYNAVFLTLNQLASLAEKQAIVKVSKPAILPMATRDCLQTVSQSPQWAVLKCSLNMQQNQTA